MASLSALLTKIKGEDGYQEKASNSNLDSKSANAGYNNYTKYSRDINSLGLMGCQGQPWCGTFQFWIEYAVFGLIKALENFCMTRSTYVAYNVFSTREAFRKKGKYVKTPKVGYLVVFKQSHIGRVIAVTATHITTMEGNTSAKYGDRNGGTVKQKTYSRNDSIIDGYCAIEYNQAPPAPKAGWVKDSKGWWYRNADGSWPANKWQLINNCWYFFKNDGYMATGWIKPSDKWYYLHPVDGQMLTGWQYINKNWYYLRKDGDMVVGWLKDGGKWYYLNNSTDGVEGSMATGWKLVKGKWYYLYASGAMAESEWVDKYYVDADGAWIENYKG